MDLTPLGLSGSATLVLQQLLTPGQRSVAQLAVVTGLADSVVSRAVRDLVQRGLAAHGPGRPAGVALSPRVAAVVRALSEDVVETARRRSAALQDLARDLEDVAAAPDVENSLYWPVPLRADAVLREQEVRSVVSDFSACVPRGRRPRGVPRRARSGARITWRVLLEGEGPKRMAVPRDTTLEVRRAREAVPWLEVLDSRLAAMEVPLEATTRTVWCADPRHVAAARAAFEWWWQQAVGE